MKVYICLPLSVEAVMHYADFSEQMFNSALWGGVVGKLPVEVRLKRLLNLNRDTRL